MVPLSPTEFRRVGWGPSGSPQGTDGVGEVPPPQSPEFLGVVTQRRFPAWVDSGTFQKSKTKQNTHRS